MDSLIHAFIEIKNKSKGVTVTKGSICDVARDVFSSCHSCHYTVNVAHQHLESMLAVTRCKDV